MPGMYIVEQNRVRVEGPYQHQRIDTVRGRGDLDAVGEALEGARVP